MSGEPKPLPEKVQAAIGLIMSTSDCCHCRERHLGSVIRMEELRLAIREALEEARRGE